MYFKNIANKDLEPFHKLAIPNFSITLTDMLTSPLFKVETIQTGSLYKIIPLFYAGVITSTNKEDRILENKAIIAEKKTKETSASSMNAAPSQNGKRISHIASIPPAIGASIAVNPTIVSFPPAYRAVLTGLISAWKVDMK